MERIETAIKTSRERHCHEKRDHYAGDGLIIDLAAEELGVVGRSVRRSLDLLRQLAGPTVFEIDELSGRHRHWYAKGVKPLFAVNVKIKRRRRKS